MCIRDSIDSLDGRRAPTILTPHAGEFARLTGRPLPLEDPLTAARDFARDHRCVLVLKGHRTVTAAPDGRAWINTTGNPGMSKGGSGDVLAGLILALLGQGLSLIHISRSPPCGSPAFSGAGPHPHIPSPPPGSASVLRGRR